MTAPTKPTRLFSLLALWLAAGWIAAGALYKLLEGSPNDLPPVVRDLASDKWGIPLSVLFPTLIAIELGVVALALFKPRWGWVMVALQLLVFLVVLGFLFAGGAESCGCFGSSVTIEPLHMAAIDGTLLVLLLATRPWSGLGSKLLPAPVALIGVAAAAAVPFVLDRRVDSPDPPLAMQGESGRSDLDSATSTGNPAADAASTDDTDTTELAPVEGVVSDPTDPLEPTPARGSGWTEFFVDQWPGQLLTETELAGFLPSESMPLDGLLIFYRQSCTHCRDHLLELMGSDDGSRPITLVRVPDDEGSAVEVVIKPSGPHVSELVLTAGVDYVVETPVEAELAGGVVLRAEEGVGVE